MRKKMVAKLKRELGILIRRKENLEQMLEQVDNLPNDQITRETYQLWHMIWGKINYLDIRIDAIEKKIEMLTDKDIIRAMISGSKGLFNYLIGGQR